jgi:hypothetical protein
MKKRKQNYYRRMDKLLFQMMKVARKENPADACAACCATLAIVYKSMNGDQRETVSPIIAQCIALITKDRPGEQVH